MHSRHESYSLPGPCERTPDKGACDRLRHAPVASVGSFSEAPICPRRSCMLDDLLHESACHVDRHRKPMLGCSVTIPSNRKPLDESKPKAEPHISGG